jgi:reactive intermediate/imine deaminase
LKETKMRILPLALALCLAAGAAAAAPPQFFAPANPKSPFSEAVRAGDMLVVSGQLGVKPGQTQAFEAEAKGALDNVAAVLARHGATMDDVVSCHVMLTDMGKWQAFNGVYQGYFKPGHMPARSVFGVSGLAVGAQVEVECEAYVGR